MPAQGGLRSETTSLIHPVGYIEVLYPGVAYPWTDDATGLKIRTNLKARDCNRRPGEGKKGSPVLFKSDAALWAWALRVRQATERGVV